MSSTSLSHEGRELCSVQRYYRLSQPKSKSTAKLMPLTGLKKALCKYPDIPHSYIIGPLIHSCMYTHMHPSIHTYIKSFVHNASKPAYVPASNHAHLYTYMYKQAYTQPYLHPYIDLHTCLQTHMHVFIYIHIYTCIYTHPHMQLRVSSNDNTYRRLSTDGGPNTGTYTPTHIPSLSQQFT